MSKPEVAAVYILFSDGCRRRHQKKRCHRYKYADIRWIALHATSFGNGFAISHLVLLRSIARYLILRLVRMVGPNFVIAFEADGKPV